MSVANGHQVIQEVWGGEMVGNGLCVSPERREKGKKKLVYRTGYIELSQRTLGAHRLFPFSGVQFWVTRTA